MRHPDDFPTRIRNFVKGKLPASLRQAVRDVKYIDTPVFSENHSADGHSPEGHSPEGDGFEDYNPGSYSPGSYSPRLELPSSPPLTSELLTQALNTLRSHYWPRLRIYFFPEEPLVGSLTESGVYRGAVVYKLCRLLGYGITTSPEAPYDIAFRHKRGTFSDPPKRSAPLGREGPAGQEDPASREDLSGRHLDAGPVLNGRSTDISKRTVNDTFEEVFGYGDGAEPSLNVLTIASFCPLPGTAR